MKLEFKVRVSLSDEFEKKIFTTQNEILGPIFREKFLSALGSLMKLTHEDKATVDHFIIKRLSDDAADDPDVKKDLTGDAQK